MHPPDIVDSYVAKQKFKMTNRHCYNKALVNRGSINFLAG